MDWIKDLIDFFVEIIEKNDKKPIKDLRNDKIVEMGVADEDKEIKWKKSPNYSIRSNREISAIVLHHTASWNFEGTLDWMCQPEAKVSAHYCISRQGEIVQLVLDQHVAWHAGKSSLEGRPHVNNFSIGIELLGNTCEKPLTEKQWNSMVWLVKRLMLKHNISAYRVVDHRKISPGRKIDLDPINFDWLAFYEEIN